MSNKEKERESMRASDNEQMNEELREALAQQGFESEESQ